MIIAALLSCSCSKEEQFLHTRDSALRVNASFANEYVASFGADGPFRWTGSSGCPRGVPCRASVKVGGCVIEKRFDDIKANESYVVEQFENTIGESFVVVRKRTESDR